MFEIRTLGPEFRKIYKCKLKQAKFILKDVLEMKPLNQIINGFFYLRMISNRKPVGCDNEVMAMKPGRS